MQIATWCTSEVCNAAINCNCERYQDKLKPFYCSMHHVQHSLETKMLLQACMMQQKDNWGWKK